MSALFDSFNPTETLIVSDFDEPLFVLPAKLWVRESNRFAEFKFMHRDRSSRQLVVWKPDENFVKVLGFWNEKFRTEKIYDAVLDVKVTFRILPPYGEDRRKRIDVINATGIVDENQDYRNEKRPIG